MTSNDDFQQFFKLHGFKLRRCLAPSMDCESQAIRAHSIQNARVLELLAVNGHVICPSLRMSNAGPEVIFSLVGRNKASTFSGFCSAHDASIFRSLDVEPFDPKNRKHLGLLAYRAVSRELHVVMESAIKIQSAYLQRVEKGWDQKDVPSPAGIEAVSWMIKSHQLFKYRSENLDSVLVHNDSADLTHDVIEMDVDAPMLAVSSLYFVDHINKSGDRALCVFNILPSDVKRTYAIFSYIKADRNFVRPTFQRILEASGSYQKYEISRLILEKMENFALSPTKYETWPDSKRKKVLEAFSGNLWTEEALSDDPDLMLF